MTNEKRARKIEETAQTEHERRVAREERERGEPTIGTEGPEDRYTGDAARPSYEEEIEAEQEGKSAREVRQQEEDPTDAGPPAYRPRSG